LSPKKAIPVFLILFAGLAAGCVPYRQLIVRESHEAPDHKPVAYDLDRVEKPIGKDDWKNEMEGLASWYGEDFNGRLTANGEVYDMYAFTAAHKTLPLGTVVKVTNVENGMTTQVRINDRGPYVEGRIIDLSRTAARALNMREQGTAKVKLEVVSWPKGQP
jgi:rare lipoprotein A (peptidoglycan hydrolase)